MNFSEGQQQAPLPLFGGVVQAQRLVLPPQVVARIASYRHACRLAWRLRRARLTQRTLAEAAGLYPSHVSGYFSVHDARRELPARHVAAVEAVLGSRLTVLEEVQAQHAALQLRSRSAA